MKGASEVTQTVLAINAFDGGSHRQFIDHAQRYSRLQWHVLTDKAVHWKWRMRHAPLSLASKTREHLAEFGRPDVVFCTDMLDVPTWKGLCDDERLTGVPVVIYFHENQFTYPKSPSAREDFHFAYTNLLSAIAADTCLFNSHFHRQDFFAACGEFLARVPDGASIHDLDAIAAKSSVVYPGFDPPKNLSPRVKSDRVRIGWVSRWEHDKRPDRLMELLKRLTKQGVEFQLILLGARPPSQPESLREMSALFGDQIIHNQHVESRSDYWHWLRQMDVVVSAADHEFYGIGLCEAVWAGAMPVVPNRLSYPELFGKSWAYENLDEAAQQIKQFAMAMHDDEAIRMQQKFRCDKLCDHFASACAQALDHAMRDIIG